MKILFLIVTFINLALSSPDYYWKDYDGVIPSDAVSGGVDDKGKPIYIGQMYLHKGDAKEGLIPTRAHEGSSSMTATKDGVHTSSMANKILCSPVKDDFGWLPATAQNLHLVAIGHHVVPGGTEESALIYIGKATYQGEVVIGKVHGYTDRELGNAKMKFSFKGEEQMVDSYEVMIFKRIPVPVDSRNPNMF